MQKKHLGIITTFLALSLMVGGTAFAAQITNTNTKNTTPHVRTMSRTGTVSVISGSTITLTINAKIPVTLTIDATSAKITKAGATITASDIKAGDILVARGTLTGTNMTAQTIMDGLPVHNLNLRNNFKNKSSKFGSSFGSTTSGTITAVNGNSFTIEQNNRIGFLAHTAKTNLSTDKTVKSDSIVPTPVTFTVNTDDKTIIRKDGTKASTTDLIVGETVMVAGTKDTKADTITATRVNINTKKPAGKHAKVDTASSSVTTTTVTN